MNKNIFAQNTETIASLPSVTSPEFGMEQFIISLVEQEREQIFVDFNPVQSGLRLSREIGFTSPPSRRLFPPSGADTMPGTYEFLSI
jgi:hypothetical protein